MDNTSCAQADDLCVVQVRVSGNLSIPIQRSILRDLHDSTLEEEIVQTAVRLSVAEHLGCFDAMTIRQCSSPYVVMGKDSEARYEAQLDLKQLSQCIRRIQHKFDTVVHSAQKMRSLLASVTASGEAKSDTMAAVTEETSRQRERQNNTAHETLCEQLRVLLDDMLLNESPEVSTAAAEDVDGDKMCTDTACDRKEEYRSVLLATASGDDDTSDEESDSAGSDTDRYTKMGYVQLK